MQVVSYELILLQGIICYRQNLEIDRAWLNSILRLYMGLAGSQKEMASGRSYWQLQIGVKDHG